MKARRGRLGHSDVDVGFDMVQRAWAIHLRPEQEPISIITACSHETPGSLSRETQCSEIILAGMLHNEYQPSLQGNRVFLSYGRIGISMIECFHATMLSTTRYAMLSSTWLNAKYYFTITSRVCKGPASRLLPCSPSVSLDHA